MLKGGRSVFNKSWTVVLHHSAEIMCMEKEGLVDLKVRQALKVRVIGGCQRGDWFGTCRCVFCLWENRRNWVNRQMVWACERDWMTLYFIKISDRVRTRISPQPLFSSHYFNKSYHKGDPEDKRIDSATPLTNIILPHEDQCNNTSQRLPRLWLVHHTQTRATVSKSWEDNLRQLLSASS